MTVASLLLHPACVTLVLALVSYYGIRAVVAVAGNAYPLPPGPPGDPFIGHVRAMPYEYEWKVFAEWGKKYGDVIYTHIFGQPLIILNSFQSAQDLMLKRSINYADRPRMVLFAELIGLETSTPFSRYGDPLKNRRRVMQQFFNPRAVVSFRPQHRKYTIRLLSDLLESPNRFSDHVHSATAAIMAMITYGHQIVSDNDPYIELVHRATRLAIEAGVPGKHPVDIFPILRHIPAWMPGAGFKRRAFIARKATFAMIDEPFDKVKRDMATRIAKPSIVSELLSGHKSNDADPEFYDTIKTAAGALYPAGVETSTDTILNFILAMVIYPEVWKKAQEEMDAVIGADRLPDFDDRASLPYIECVLKETLRWNPTVPLGLPHQASQSDIYDGKYIPAGATIIANIWYMMHDERFYPNPDKFWPERFLHASDSKGIYDPTSVVFGFGRRVCAGKYFAVQSLWLTMAYIMAVFKILPALDKDGREIIPKAEFTSSFTSRPKPFDCRFVPRSDKAASLVRQYSTSSE